MKGSLLAGLSVLIAVSSFAQDVSYNTITTTSINSDTPTSIRITGQNDPVGVASLRKISFEFQAAGKAQIQSYRGSVWSTYLQFLTADDGDLGGTPSVRMHISGNGNVGIGSLSPESRLTVRDNNPFVDIQSAEDSQKTGLWMRYQSSTYAGTKLYYSTGDATTYLDNLYPNEAGTQYGSFNVRSKNNMGELLSRLFVHGVNGNIGIGTTSPNEKLAVNGKIRAREIKVENSNWPDYVFAPSYKIPTLQETEKHIKKKGHLPGIPSASEVKANGVDLGDMNAKLLQKIEELTLHLIEQNKTLENQNKQIESQNTRIEHQNQDLQDLKIEVKQLKSNKK